MTKRPFTSRIEAVKDVLAFPFFRRDWVGVQCTKVQDRKKAKMHLLTTDSAIGSGSWINRTGRGGLIEYIR